MLKLPKWMLDCSTKLIGQSCTKTMFVKWKVTDEKCLRLAMSKVLSLGIISGSVLVKLPQIGKLLYTRSTDGLSFLAYLLETMATSINFAYNLRAGNPFTTYGETLFITLQNLFIVLLLGVYRKQFTHLLLILAVYSVFMSGLLLPNLYPLDGVWLNYLQAATIPIAAASRIPQIYKIWCTGHTGQLSAATVFLVALGSCARLFTTIQEVGNDQLLLVGFGMGAFLNSVIALQMIWYWNSSPRTTVSAKKKRT